jgi:transcriptional regulator of heat shock response
MPRQARTEGELLEDILERLELLVNLTGMLVTSERSTTEAARALKMAGLDNQSIAAVLNTTEGSVRTLTANLRVKIGRGRR